PTDVDRRHPPRRDLVVQRVAPEEGRRDVWDRALGHGGARAYPGSRPGSTNQDGGPAERLWEQRLRGPVAELSIRLEGRGVDVGDGVDPDDPADDVQPISEDGAAERRAPGRERLGQLGPSRDLTRTVEIGALDIRER